MPRKTRPRIANLPAPEATGAPDGLISEVPISYPIAGTAVTALQVYSNPDRRPSASGPWDGEGDKIAWVDQASGLGCIILRQVDGTLSGYCGVGPDHPLFGFAAGALPVDVAHSVHGGVTYARACEVNRFERRAHGAPRAERYTVCHVTEVRYVQQYRTVQATRDEFHEDLWWFGFDTDHAGDLIPRPRASQLGRRGGVYRDQDFVYGNVIALACQLRGIADSGSSEAEGDIPRLPAPPPAGAGK